jgi:DNA-binding beta-propeller fold protein YncE
MPRRPSSVRSLGCTGLALCCAVLSAAGLAAAPAAQATLRAVPAGREYPVLVDGSSRGGTGMLTELGPTWTASFRLKDPGAIAVAPNGKHAYVVTSGGLAVLSNVNTAHPKITATVRTGGTPGGIAVTPSGTQVYVTVSSAKRSLVKEYAGALTGKLRLVASVAAKPGANAIAITPDGKYAYVAVNDVPYAYYLTEIAGIGTAHLKVLRNMGIAGYPEAVTVTPNGQFVYEVSNMGLSSAAVAFKHAQSAHPAVAKGFSPPRLAGLSPVAVTPDGRWAYAAYLHNLIVIKNAQTSPVKDGTAKVSPAGGQMAMQPDGAYAIEAGDSTSGGLLAVLTGTSSGHPKVAATWKLSFYPYNLAISPAR